MGWEVQGYYKKPDEIAPCWHLDCSGDFMEEVEAFGERNPLESKDSEELEIYFGNRGLEIIRGISTLAEEKKLKEQLRKFDGYLLYADKWTSEIKAFRSDHITCIKFASFWVFQERIEKDAELLKRGLEDLLDRLQDKGPEGKLAAKQLKVFIEKKHADEKG